MGVENDIIRDLPCINQKSESYKGLQTMSTVDKSPRAIVHPSVSRIVTASLIGSTIEWYDFYIFIAASAVVFNVLFFPTVDPLTGTIAAFATFAVGFVARPLGAILFGHWGDRVGRKSALIATLLIMGVATVAVGLLPTYEKIGIWAPMLLVMLRFLQGIAVGGEWGGAVLVAVEHAPTNQRVLFGSFAQMGSAVGVVLSAGIFAILQQLLSAQEFRDWGWRVPFLLSAVLIVVGFIVRSRLTESPVFQRVLDRREAAKIPAFDVIAKDWRALLFSIGIMLATITTFYVGISFMIVYARKIGLSPSVPLFGQVIASGFGILLIPLGAWLSDKYGARLIMIISTVLSMLCAFPMFWLASSGVPSLLWLGMLLCIGATYPSYAAMPTYLSDRYQPRVRYSAISMSYQFSALVAGTLTPFITTVLFAKYDSYVPVAIYTVIIGLISLACMIFWRARPTADAGF